MKKIIVGVLAILVAGAAWAGDMPEGWTPPKPSAELQRIKALEDNWTATEKTETGSKTTIIQYKVTSGGTAVTETIDPGTSHELISVYHDKAGKLAMTHYCMLGNQPEMELKASTDNKIELSESAASQALLNGQLRMSSLTIEQLDANTLTTTWSGTNADGSAGKPMVFNLKKS